MRLFNIYESLAGGNLATASPVDQNDGMTDSQNHNEIDLTDPALANQPELGQEPPAPAEQNDDIDAQAQTMQQGMPKIPPQLSQLDQAFNKALNTATPGALGNWVMARTKNLQSTGPIGAFQ
jgi:hypothetical protein